MNKKEYQQGIRYATVLVNHQNAKDLVHDAYLRWYDKTNRDLFDEPNGTVIRVIKNTRQTQFSRDGFYFRGTTYRKQYKRLDDPEEAFQLESLIDPEHVLISKEMFELIQAGLKPFDVETFLHMVEGYLVKESIELQNTHGVEMTASLKRVKERIKDVVGDFVLYQKEHSRKRVPKKYSSAQ